MSTLLNSRLAGLTGKSFERIPERNLERTGHFGKASKTQFDTNLKVDEEIEFTLVPEVDVNIYQEDASSPQELTNGKITIKVQYPLFYNFLFSDPKIKQVNEMPHEESSIFMSDIVKNASDKFENFIEYSYLPLISQAGFKLNSSIFYDLANTTPIPINMGNVKQLFQNLHAMMGKGQIVAGVPRSSWVDGKMSVIVPYELTALLIAAKDFQFTPLGEQDKIDGYIGKYAGFKILESNYLTADANGNYSLFAFIDGEALGTIMQKALTSEHIRWQLRFGDVFRGLGIFGVGMVRPDKCATAYLSLDFTSQTTI